MLPSIVSVKLTAILGAAALVAGAGLGGWAAHAFYAPRLELERTRVDALAGALTIQNTAVERLQDEAKERARRAKKALADAKAEAEQAMRDAMDILTRQPPPDVDRCTAASALVRQELAK